MDSEAEKVVVTGARGMLGTDLCATLRDAGFAVTACDLPEVDITDPTALPPLLENAAAVVNCAAFTNVDGAESTPDIARAVNAAAVGSLGRQAAERDIHVIHISTDFVFDGTLDRPYRESDTPSPLSVYGCTKLEGEQLLGDSGCRHAVVRVQWTYGQGGANFISKFLARARASDALMMVADQVGSPTWTAAVAAALVDLLEQRCEGLYHFAADGFASRFEVAEAVLEETGLQEKSLRPCRTSDFPAAAQRPLNSRFDCSKIDDCLRRRRPHWRASLTRFIREHLSEARPVE